MGSINPKAVLLRSSSSDASYFAAPTAFGAALNGTTDDSAALQTWIDWVEAQASALYTKIRIQLPPAKEILLDAGISLDVSKIYLDMNGCVLLPTSNVTGKVVNLTTTNNNQSAKGSQLLGGIGYGTIVGAGKTVGTLLGFTNAGLGPAHASVDLLYMRNALVGMDWSAANTYLNRFREPWVSGCATGVKMTNVSNSGEAMLFLGGGVGSCDMAFDLSDPDADVILKGTSLDFNAQVFNITDTRVMASNARIENSGPTLVQGTVGGSQGYLLWQGGSILASSGSNHAVDDWFTTSGEGRIDIVDTFTNNTRNTTHRFGSGKIFVIRPKSHNNPNNCRLWSREQSLLDMSASGIVPSNIKVAGATTNRLAFGGATLAQSTALGGGINSLLYTKTSAGGATDANWEIYIPVNQGFGDCITWELTHAKASGGTSENWFYSERWAEIVFTGDGLPSAVWNTIIGTSSAKTSSTTPATEGSNGFNASTRRAPPRATHFMLTFNMNSIVGTQAIHFYDFYFNRTNG